MKTKLISISLILLITLTGCINIEAPQKDRDIADVPDPKQEPKDQPCDFSKEIDLKQAENYDQFGSEEFQTVVCGYFTSNQEEIFGETYNIAYFNVLKFIDEDFKQSIKEGIETGNTVNKQYNSDYSLNLGCYEDGVIKGTDYQENESSIQYMNDEVMEAILNSSKDDPVSIILTYGIHQGRGCTCCNLMHNIRLY